MCKQMLRPSTGSEFPSYAHLHYKRGTLLEHVLLHSNDITDLQMIHLAPEGWDYLTRTLCPHHRGSGEIMQGRRGPRDEERPGETALLSHAVVFSVPSRARVLPELPPEVDAVLGLKTRVTSLQQR